jgi:hypothetical protein
MLAVEHTRAFATVDLEMTTPPEPIKLESVLPLPPIAPTIVSTTPAIAAQSSPTPVPPVTEAPPLEPPPMPTPVVAKTPERDTVVLRRGHVAVLASLITVLLIAVAGFVYMALARRPPSPPDAGTTASATTPTAPPAVASVEPAPVSIPSTPAGAGTAPAPDAPSPAAALPPTSTLATPSTSADGAGRDRASPTPADAIGTVKPPAATRPPALPPTATAPVRQFTPVVFEVKALVVDGERTREHDARAVFADGRITVTPKDGPNPLHDVPYDSVLSISYSQGRDPLWRSPSGPAPVARAGGGTLGIFRGERHWLSVQAKDRILVVRLENEPDVRRVIAALEERTGNKTVRVSERKDAK